MSGKKGATGKKTGGAARGRPKKTEQPKEKSPEKDSGGGNSSPKQSRRNLSPASRDQEGFTISGQ